MAETSQEKTEQATDRRKRDARKKGTVAKSQDLTSSSVTVVMLMCLPVALGMLGSGFVQEMKAGFMRLNSQPNQMDVLRAFANCLMPTLAGVGLIMACAMGTGLAANIAQVGLSFSPEAMVPNFSKLNPFEGLKRMLSSRSLFETGKASVKMGLFGLIAYQAIAAHWNEIGSMSYISPLGSLELTGVILRTVGLRVALVWAALAGADYYFQRKQVQKSLMMSKQEVKQEHKEQEGSPETRMARNMRRRRMRRMSMKKAVQSADVVITNPTHFAVALKYDPLKSHAPIVVAKGQDLMAARIREAAKENRVPIVPNPPLARALYKQCEVGDVVPRELFQAVAEILAYVYRMIGSMKGR